MNIFYLSPEPRACARYHCDKHVVKMILELGQLLSTAHRVLDGKEYVDSSSGRRIKRWKLENPIMDSTLYKATHINHPSAVWCRSGVPQYLYTLDLFYALIDEYEHRYGKTHACTKLETVLVAPPKNIDKAVDWNEPPQAMPEDCRIKGDSVEAYRLYYTKYKYTFAKWKNRMPPHWWQKPNDGKKEDTHNANL